MSRDECAPYSAEESHAEQAATNQKAMDVLFMVGNRYDIRLDHMRLLCDVAGVSFDDLCKYAGKPVTCKTGIF